MSDQFARRAGTIDQRQFRSPCAATVARAARRAARRLLARRCEPIERLEERRLLSSIAGTLWDDVNANRTQDAGESPLANWTVYLDQNRNHARDAAETFTTTNASGAYSFPGLAAGTYYVAEELKAGWEQTHPGSTGIAARPTPGTGVNALTLTNSDVPIHFDGGGSTGRGVDTLNRDGSHTIRLGGDPGSTTPVTPSDLESSPLIGLPTMRADSRFAGVDGRGFSVAVLDTGIDLDHPFFGPDNNADGVADRIVYQHDFANNDSDATDFNGHGTNVSSIIGGRDATYDGMAPKVNLIALKVFTDAGSGTFGYIEQALQWVVANAAAYNIAAVNMSLGDQANWNTAQQLYGISDELGALAAMNVIVCSADGNSFYTFGSAQGVAYPAADPNSLAVGATWDANAGGPWYWGDGAIDNTTAADRITSFSQRSAALTSIFAPGALITGAGLNGGLTSYAGTSQATPHIAGIAALAQQLAVQELGRRLTLAEFRSLLQSTGTSIVDGDDENDNVTNTGATFKRVNAAALANAIYAMGSGESFGYKLALGAADDRTAISFGNRRLPTTTSVPDLRVDSDTGVAGGDNLTNLDNSSISNRLWFHVSGTIPGATLSIWADGVQIGSVYAPTDLTDIATAGTFDLADGTHVITARQQVPGDALSPASGGLTITIDTTAPSAPAAPSLLASSDSGISNSDGITSVNQPTLSVATTAPYFRLYRDGFVLSGQYQDAGLAATTNFSITSPLADATYSFTATSVDAAGNVSAISTATPVTIDTSPYPAPPAAIDSTFGPSGNGQAGLTTPAADNDWFRVVAVQADGKIVAAGSLTDTTVGTGLYHPQMMTIARFNANGSVDTSFGNQGQVNLKIMFASEAMAVAALSDGHIVVAGYAGDGAANGNSGYVSPRFCVARLNANGSLDTSFGGSGTGYVVSQIGPAGSQIADMLITQAGKILVAGSAANGTQVGAAVAQYSASGILEWTQMIPFYNKGAGASALTLDNAGRIVVTGGMWYSNTDATGFLMRLLPTGAFDTTLDGDGVLETRLFGTGRREILSDLVVAPDGKIFIAGYANSPADGSGQTDLFVRYTDAGALDTTFDGDGVLQGPGYHGWQHIYRAADGKIWAAGSGGGFYVGRFNPDGSPDSSFAPAGISATPVSGDAGDIAPLLDGTGRMIAAGSDYNSSTWSDRVVIRFNAGSKAAPLVLQPASDSGASNTDRITNDNTPTFDLPAVPLGGGYYYRVYRNGVMVSGSYAPGTSFTAATQPDGSANWSASIVDTAGNESGASDPINVTIDTAAPTVSTSAFSYLTGPQTVRFNFSEPVTTAQSSTLVSATNLATNTTVPGTTFAYDPATRRLTLTFNSRLPDGNYRAFITQPTSWRDTAGNALDPAGTTLDCFFLNGDADHDRDVDLTDFTILAANFNGTGRNFAQGDFDYSGTVDLTDFTILAANFNKTLPPSASASVLTVNVAAKAATPLAAPRAWFGDSLIAAREVDDPLDLTAA